MTFVVECVQQLRHTSVKQVSTRFTGVKFREHMCETYVHDNFRAIDLIHSQFWSNDTGQDKFYIQGLTKH